MFGLFKSAKPRRAPRFHPDRVLDDALQEHTETFFFSGQALSNFGPDVRDRMIADLRERINGVYSSANGKEELRRLIVECVLLYAGVTVLALTEGDKAVMEYGRNPYITGQLHHHIRRAAELNDEMRPQLHQGASDAELVAFANTRGAVMLYYANALNMVRIRRGDIAPSTDWYRPFVEAMLAWEEDNARERLGLPRQVPGELHGLPYLDFMEIVLAGEPDPVAHWKQKFPQLHLHGHIAPL